MSVHRLERVQLLGSSLRGAWDFFSDPRNLGAITPPEMEFAIQYALPPRVHEGLLITYRLRPLVRIPVTWVTEITHVRELEFFVDEQRLGPYRLWHHQHHFRELPDGVEMHDVVHYALPFGMLGDVAERLLVRPRLRRLFDYRRRVLEARFPLASAGANPR